MRHGAAEESADTCPGLNGNNATLAGQIEIICPGFPMRTCAGSDRLVRPQISGCGTRISISCSRKHAVQIVVCNRHHIQLRNNVDITEECLTVSTAKPRAQRSLKR